MNDPLLIQPGLILQAPLPAMPLRREHAERRFVRIARVMAKMIDIELLDTEFAATEHPFVFMMKPKAGSASTPAVAQRATGAAAPQFAFASTARATAATAPPAEVTPANHIQRTTKESFTAYYANWSRYEQPSEVWVHAPVERATWDGDSLMSPSSRTSYSGPKITAGVREAIGESEWTEFCQTCLGYLPVEITVDYHANTRQRGNYSHNFHTVKYLLLQSPADLCAARLRFGSVVTN